MQDYDVNAEIQPDRRYRLFQRITGQERRIPIPGHEDALYNKQETWKLLAEFRPTRDTSVTEDPNRPDALREVTDEDTDDEN